jgi:hypothetical protein
LQIDGHAVLLQQIGEGLVSELLRGRHAITPKLRQLIQRVVIECDQLSHGQPSLDIKQHARESFQNGELAPPAVVQSERRIAMAQISKIMALAAAAMLLSSTAALTQSSAGGAGGGATGGAAGTNSAGTANSGGGRAPTGTGSGVGANVQSYDGKPSTGNQLVDEQDRAVDRKVKNICKGC